MERVIRDSLYQNLAKIAKDEGRLFMAIDYLNAAIAIAPNLGVNYARRAEISMVRRDYKSALIDLDTAIRLEPTPELYCWRSEVRHQAYCQLLTELELTSSPVGFDLNANPASIATDLTAALCLNPHYTKARYLRACYYLNVGKIELALADLDLALALDPTFGKAYQLRAEINLFYQKDYTCCLWDLIMAVTGNPQDIANYCNLAWYHFQIGAVATAFEYLHSAINFDSNHPQPYYFRAKIYRELEKWGDVVKNLKIALDLYIPRGEFIDVLQVRREIVSLEGGNLELPN